MYDASPESCVLGAVTGVGFKAIASLSTCNLCLKLIQLLKIFDFFVTTVKHSKVAQITRL